VPCKRVCSLLQFEVQSPELAANEDRNHLIAGPAFEESVAVQEIPSDQNMLK